MKLYLLLTFFLITQIESFAQITFASKKTGMGLVTDITHAGDGSSRVFVASKSGTVTILDGTTYATLGTLLDISSIISTDSEKGLLGLVFHPNFETNGYFYVNYNPSGTNNTVIARFTAATPSANTTVNNNTQKIIITITGARFGNHKAGDLAFGPDGYLYVPTGDGGDGGDPDGNGQNGLTLLGKILRLDVNTTNTNPGYLIPSTNPYTNNANVRDEIWDMGLRNPWRISFDRQTNDFWIADVGQSAREEINFEASGTTGGYNYGWNCREGKIAYNGCLTPASSFREPIFDYSRCNPCPNPGFGNSLTGGFVYRGTKPANASMVGYYIFADYVSRHAWMLKYNSSSIVDTQLIATFTPNGITSFGELENGELMAGTSAGAIGTIEATGCNQPPTISISSSSTTYVRGSSFTVNATVNDADGTVSRVEFYNNTSELLGTDMTAPFSFTVSPANNASYSITGRAYDNCSLSTNSTALAITTTVSCSDGYQNGTETGVDCGGSCTACIAPCAAVTNLSQGKTTSQSSTLNANYSASKLVDGISNNFNHTNNEAQPWWQVDLGTAFQVGSIEITGRQDCCSNRLKRFKIFISNSEVGSYNSAGSVYLYNNASGLGNGQILNVPNLNAIGRYVRIWMDNTGLENGTNPLHLAEVKVMGCSNCQGNQNPTVSISSNASSYPQGSSFTINATANDPGGLVSRVEFYNGANLLSSDDNAPYSHTINPASASSYSITAKAFDDCNGMTTSNLLTINTTSTCSDGYQNGTETGVDCGGSCTACQQGCGTVTNLSQGKTASQSSTLNANYAASKLVDGITNNLSHTNNELRPWWQVDLGGSYQVSTIEIINRPDCCGNRLKRFKVFISNSEVNSYSGSGSVFEYDNPTGPANGQTITVSNINLSGRYVRIWMDNTGYGDNPLHLAEVRVLGCASNCQNNQAPTASISSTSGTYPQGSSFTINAAAGDTDGTISYVEFYDGSTLLSSDNMAPYSHTINIATASSYSFTAKAFDNCNGTKISNTLTVTTTSTCSDGYRNGTETGVDCGGNCSPCPAGCSTSTNLSQGKTATQSSTLSATYAASKLVDGLNNNFNHTNNEAQPWWQVDLGSNYQISSIEIVNRPDCCGNRLKKFKVFVSSTVVSSYSSAGSVFEYNNSAGAGNGQVLNIPNINTSGQYIRIWMDNTGLGNNPLHLAEVRVLGCQISGSLVSENPQLMSSFQQPSNQYNGIAVQLFPNPARESLRFRFDVQPEGEVNAQIYDLQGRMVISEKLKNNEIDIARLESGSYIVRVQTKAGLTVHKVVKM